MGKQKEKIRRWKFMRDVGVNVWEKRVVFQGKIL